MISAQEALYLTDHNNMGVADTIDEWLSERIKSRCEKGKHHLTLTHKDMRIMNDEWGITPDMFEEFVRKAGYKVAYDSSDRSYVMTWGE